MLSPHLKSKFWFQLSYAVSTGSVGRGLKGDEGLKRRCVVAVTFSAGGVLVGAMGRSIRSNELLNYLHVVQRWKGDEGLQGCCAVAVGLWVGAFGCCDGKVNPAVWAP